MGQVVHGQLGGSKRVTLAARGYDDGFGMGGSMPTREPKSSTDVLGLRGPPAFVDEDLHSPCSWLARLMNGSVLAAIEWSGSRDGFAPDIHHILHVDVDLVVYHAFTTVSKIVR